MDRYNTPILKDPIVINAENNVAANMMAQPLMNSVAALPNEYVAVNLVGTQAEADAEDEEIDAEEAIKTLTELDANNNTMELKIPTRTCMLNTLINAVLVLLLVVLILQLVYNGKCFPNNLFKK